MENEKKISDYVWYVQGDLGIGNFSKVKLAVHELTQGRCWGLVVPAGGVWWCLVVPGGAWWCLVVPAILFLIETVHSI